MTIFAGVFSRRGSPLPDSACDTLRRSVSRDTRDAVQEFADAHLFLVKVDIGAFPDRGFLIRSGGTVSVLAGEPLLATADPGMARARSADLALLHEGWDRGDSNLLKTARGVFCAAHYHPRDRRLTLLVDKLGLRPLYYWIGDEYVVFATALRILEALPQVPKQMDLRAVTEMVCLGVPLGDRTPYTGVQLLRAAEMVQVSAGGVARSQYWRWDHIQPSDAPEPELLQRAYDRFSAAVACRLRGNAVTTAFLSGGLDSRCVVAALRSQGAHVRTFNFGLPRTQDHVFGTEFARACGAEHVSVPMKPAVEIRFSTLMTDAMQAFPPGDAKPERRRIVWSGEGGSLGTGHIYQTRHMVELLRAGRSEEAITLFLDRQGAHVPRRLFRRDLAESLARIPREGMCEELQELRLSDPGRGIHMFLLLNDQRRHLGTHFEDIDLHRLEFEVPFFDSDFLQTILETPIDLCLYHRFYVNWLGLFPAVVTSVPWQTYPGHVACPIPVPEGLHYQWESRRPKAVRTAIKRALRHRMDHMLAAPRFPDDLLRKSALRLAGWLHQTGVRDYGYVLTHATLYYTYWSRSGGRWVSPGTAPAPSLHALQR